MGNGCKHFCGTKVPERDPILYHSMSPKKFTQLDSSPFTSDFIRVRPSDFIEKKSGSIQKDYKISKSLIGKGIYIYILMNK